MKSELVGITTYANENLGSYKLLIVPFAGKMHLKSHLGVSLLLGIITNIQIMRRYSRVLFCVAHSFLFAVTITFSLSLFFKLVGRVVVSSLRYCSRFVHC